MNEVLKECCGGGARSQSRCGSCPQSGFVTALPLYADLPEWAKMDDLGGLVPSEIRQELRAFADATHALRVGASGVQVDAPRWMPIESAPKDGTPVLLGRFTGKKGEHEGLRAVDWYRTDANRQGFTGWGKFNAQFWPPTHWQPIDAAPVQVKGEA